MWFIVDIENPATFLHLDDFRALGLQAKVIQPSSAVIKDVSGYRLVVHGKFVAR